MQSCPGIARKCGPAGTSEVDVREVHGGGDAASHRRDNSRPGSVPSNVSSIANIAEAGEGSEIVWEQVKDDLINYIT
jgi:hypothetical protein